VYMPEDINKLFAEGDVEGLLTNLYEGVESLKDSFDLEFGPLEKTPETTELEKLFNHIVSGHTVRITSTGDPLEYIASVEHKGIVKPFNISNLLKKADLNHIELKKDQMKKYEQYTSENGPSVRKPEKSNFAIGYPTKAYFKSRDPNGTLDNLKYAEKIAINIYTSSFYGPMNALLRGVVSPINDDPTQEQQVKEALIHSIMSASGLNKISNVQIPGSLRGESIFSQEVLQKRILMVNEGQGSGVTLEQGFISSSMGSTPFGGGSKILFTGLVGKSVAAISVYPHEREYLIPPTQVLWKRHKKVGDTHYFHAMPVSTITKEPTLQELAAKKATKAEAAALAAGVPITPAIDLAAGALAVEAPMTPAAMQPAGEVPAAMGPAGEVLAAMEPAGEVLEVEAPITPETEAAAKAQAAAAEQAIIDIKEAEKLLQYVKQTEELYKKEGWRMRKALQRDDQIKKLVGKANDLLLPTCTLSPNEKLTQIKGALNEVWHQIDEETKHKSKAALFFSKKSRLKKVIEKLDPDVSKKPKPN
jgi:hypothetical protein